MTVNSVDAIKDWLYAGYRRIHAELKADEATLSLKELYQIQVATDRLLMRLRAQAIEEAG